jgi:hypothetical protein
MGSMGARDGMGLLRRVYDFVFHTILFGVMALWMFGLFLYPFRLHPVSRDSIQVIDVSPEGCSLTSFYSRGRSGRSDGVALFVNVDGKRRSFELIPGSGEFPKCDEMEFTRGPLRIGYHPYSILDKALFFGGRPWLLSEYDAPLGVVWYLASPDGEMVSVEKAAAAFSAHYRLDPEEPFLFRYFFHPLFMPAVFASLLLYAFLNRNKRPEWIRKLQSSRMDGRT